MRDVREKSRGGHSLYFLVLNSGGKKQGAENKFKVLDGSIPRPNGGQSVCGSP